MYDHHIVENGHYSPVSSDPERIKGRFIKPVKSFQEGCGIFFLCKTFKFGDELQGNLAGNLYQCMPGG
jgi:hypothetical protein